MQTSVESGEGLQRHLLVDIPADRVNQAVDEKLTELATQVRLDGFRPGKVPPRIVKQRFGEQVRQDVYGELIETTFYPAAEEQQLTPVGKPSIEFSEAAEKGGFCYKATFDVMPTIELADLAGKPLKRPVAEVTDADVTAMIEKLREQRTTSHDVERAAQNGDTLYIDFTGTIDGEAFAGGEGKDMSLKLGSGDMVDGFESGLLGVRAGEERTLEITFPQDYFVKDLVGKQADFAVKVNRVTESRLPEIDAEFNQSYGVDEGTETALRDEVHKNIQLELKQKLQALCKSNVMDLLREANPLDIPQAMVEQEAEHMRRQMLGEMQLQNQQAAQQLPASLFADQAKIRVHLGLLSTEIIRKQSFEASEDDLREIATDLSQSYQEPEKIIDYYLNSAEQRASLENLVLENKVVDWVLEQTEVQDEQMTFEEVMEPESAA